MNPFFGLSAAFSQTTSSSTTISPQPSRTPNPMEIIKNMGFIPVNEKPIPFHLQDLDGNTRNLEEFKGQWIWLAFWATWCGPCAYEMPILEGLHQEFKNKGLKVIGISVDQGSPQFVKKYIQQKNITFPILHDRSSKVANAYQSSAIPSIYLISPDWKLVGIFRGANNWESASLLNALEQMLSIKEITEEDMALYTDSSSGSGNDRSNSLNLPQNLVPPQLVWVPISEADLETRKKIDFEIKIQWKGDPQNYFLHPPQITLPEGVESGPISSFSQSFEDNSELIYRIPLTFKNAGRYSIGPVELSYQARQGSAEQYSRLSSIEVEIKDNGLGRFFSPWNFTVTFLFLLAIISIYLFRRSKGMGSKSFSSPEGFLQRKKESDYSEIQRFKLYGPKKKYDEGILRLYLELFPSLDQDGQRRVQKLLEEIQYAGKELSIQELNYFEKSIEKSLSGNDNN